MFKKPEYCAACHKQFIDQEVNRVGWVQLQNQYDNWAASHWNKKATQPNGRMPRVSHATRRVHDPAAGDSSDYNRTPADGKHRSHRFLAANTFVPAFCIGRRRKHIELTKVAARHIAIPEIRNKWADGPIVKVRIEAPEWHPGANIPIAS